MKRRLPFILVLICTCMCLTSCKLLNGAVGLFAFEKGTDAIAEVGNDITTAVIGKKLEAANSVGMSEKTREAAEDLQEAVDKVNNQETGWNVFKAITDDDYAMWWNEDRQRNKLNEKLKDSNSTFDAASKADTKEKVSQKAFQFKKFIPIIVLVGILLLLLLFLKKKHPKKLKMKPAPVAVSTARTGLYDTSDYQSKQLQELCTTAGIDYGAVTAKFGTDVKGLTRAYTKLAPLVQKGDTERIQRLLE